MHYGAIATGDRPILIRCAEHHARAVQCYEFAENQCEYVTFMCRALSERPYDIHDTLIHKLYDMK